METLMEAMTKQSEKIIEVQTLLKRISHLLARKNLS